MDTTEISNTKEIKRLYSEIDKFCNESLKPGNIRQVTIDFLQHCLSDIIHEENVTPDDIGAHEYDIDVLTEVMDAKIYKIDFDILINLSGFLHMLKQELIKAKK